MGLIVLWGISLFSAFIIGFFASSMFSVGASEDAFRKGWQLGLMEGRGVKAVHDFFCGR